MFRYKTQNKHGIFRRFHAFVFVFAILFISSAVTISNHQTASAADIPLGQTTDTQIQKLLLHRFLGFCINNAPLAGGVLFDNGRRITGTAAANSGDWFTDSSPPQRQTSAPIGPYMLDTRFGVNPEGSRTEAKAHCGDNRLIKLAIDSLGATGVEVLCKSGFVRNDGSPCVGGNGDFQHANNSGSGSADAYNAFIRAYPEPALDDLGWYWFYRKTFNWSCGYGKMSNPVSQADADSSPDFGYALVYINDEAPNYKSSKYFIGLERRNTNVNTRLVEGGSGNAVVRSCAQIEAHINDYGNRIAAAPQVIEDAASQTPSDDGEGTSSPGETNCVVEGVGWIVCPATILIAKMTDALYGWIQNFLIVQPLNVDTSSNSNTTYIAWSAMRSIANLLFVIAFMIIIFSQLTGVGVSNYGVKKLLPRLVVAAILVNISYWVVAIAVDISNIFGNYLYSLIRELPLGDITITDNLWESVVGWLLAGGAGAGAVIAGVAFASSAGAVLTAALWAAVVFVLGAVLALIVAFIIMAARQALVIIFIVLAPLAFVAYLLPNTEKIFNTWRKGFITLLVFYPLFSVLFGGSYLAGMIIIGSAGQGNDEAAVASMVLLGMAVMVIPLALTPLLIRFSTGIMGTIAGMVNNKNKGLVDRARNVRKRKSSLAMHEALSRPGRRNPFARLYRRVQGSAAGDAERKKIVDARNQANFLETQRSKNLNLKSGLEQERVKTAQGEQNAEFENTVLADNTLMEMRQQQDASERATSRHKALQNEKIESNLSVTSMMNEQQKANAELKTSVIKNQRELDIEKNQLSSTELKNAKLQGAAIEKESGVVKQQFQQVVAEAGSVKGAEKLKKLGYDEDTLAKINQAQTQASVISSATTSAQNIQQQEYAQTLTDNVLQVRSHDGPAVPIQEAAGGIDPQGASRVRAAANAVNLEVINKAISSEKSTMTSMPVRTTAATATEPEKPGLMEILTTTVVNEKGETVYAATPERMAAAAGQIIRVGGDADIHALIDQVDRMPEDTDERKATKSLVLQQIASDIGPRTPTSLGAGTLSNMTRGVSVGGFDKMVSSRLTSGKVSPEKLFTGTSAEELERMIAVISDPKRFTTPSTPEEVANLANLKSDIKNYLDNPTTKPPTPEIARLVEQLREKLPG